MYDRSKLHKALMIAFGKKNLSLDQVDDIISGLESKRSGKSKEITSEKIGKDVLSILKKIDEVAYVRFASVFMEFEGVKDFERIVKEK